MLTTMKTTPLPAFPLRNRSNSFFRGRRTVNQRGYGADWPKRHALKSLILWQ